jgi:hypothetical protein
MCIFFENCIRSPFSSTPAEYARENLESSGTSFWLSFTWPSQLLSPHLNTATLSLVTRTPHTQLAPYIHTSRPPPLSPTYPHTPNIEMSRSDEPHEHWNSYRPSYWPHGPDSPPNQDAALPYNNDDSDARLDRNPIPPHRRSHTSPTSSFDARLWSTDLTDLMSRTCRAYDLVINYAHDCPLGTRWSAPDIERVRETGKHLHEDVRLLKYWRAKVEKSGDGDEDMMSRIRQDVAMARKLCEDVQDVIEETENMPSWNGKAGMGKDVEMEDEKYAHDAGETASYKVYEVYKDRGADRGKSTHYTSLSMRGRGNTTIDTYRPGRASPIGRMGKYDVYR